MIKTDNVNRTINQSLFGFISPHHAALVPSRIWINHCGISQLDVILLYQYYLITITRTKWDRNQYQLLLQPAKTTKLCICVERRERECDSSNKIPSWEPHAGYGSVCKSDMKIYTHNSCSNWVACGCKHWWAFPFLPLRLKSQIRAGGEKSLSKNPNVV